ncbi:MAG: hypothetical protein JNL42_14635 [Anaerolineae bacterium]|nr:hypothetical protein [Anaerolineae bacterium]
MRRAVAALLFALSSLLIVSLLHAQTERALRFDVPDEPTIPHGQRGTWDGQYTDPGAVVYHDGVFHMFRNGFVGWPAPVHIAYHTSTDGLNWQMVGAEPIIKAEDSPYDGLAVLASSALVEDDGTWVLYCYVWSDASSNPGMQIVRATAPAPTGPWTFRPEPVLSFGSAGAWDSYGVTVPTVVKSDDGYIMLYSGIFSRPPGSRIGLATSADGITWTKYDDPTTTDPEFAESDPVFVPEDVPWAADAAHQPRARLTPDGLVLLYRTFTRNQQDISFGIALSDDGGVTWRSAADEPALIWNDPNVLEQIWFSELEYADGQYFGFFEVNRGTTTNVHAAPLIGSLGG